MCTENVTLLRKCYNLIFGDVWPEELTDVEGEEIILDEEIIEDEDNNEE